jgi:hypothetical protein
MIEILRPELHSVTKTWSWYRCGYVMLWPSAQVPPLSFLSFLSFHQKPKRRGKKTENKGKLNK